MKHRVSIIEQRGTQGSTEFEESINDEIRKWEGKHGWTFKTVNISEHGVSGDKREPFSQRTAVLMFQKEEDSI